MMTIEECKRIINNEQLNDFNWFDEHEFRGEEVCIRRVKDKIVVFTISERCSPIKNSIIEFTDESLVLQEFIERLRADKILKEFNRKSTK